MGLGNALVSVWKSRQKGFKAGNTRLRLDEESYMIRSCGGLRCVVEWMCVEDGRQEGCKVVDNEHDERNGSLGVK